MSELDRVLRRAAAKSGRKITGHEHAEWLAGYAAAREQAAREADEFDQRDTYACGAIASAIRAMTPEKGDEAVNENE